MDRLIVVRVVLQLQAVECDSLRTDGNLREIGPDLGGESVLIHAEEAWGSSTGSARHSYTRYRLRKEISNNRFGGTNRDRFSISCSKMRSS